MKNLFIAALALIFIAGACKTSGNVAQSANVGSQADDIVEKYWKLVELNGSPVVFDDSLNRNAFLILKAEDNRVNANGGCNTLSGTYELDRATMRIRFSQMISTMIACLDMEVEEGLKRAFEMADNYAVSPDGKFLSLNRARMAPLARFELDYLR